MIYVVFLSSITPAVQRTEVHLILQQLLKSLEDDTLLFSETTTIDHLEVARKITKKVPPQRVARGGGLSAGAEDEVGLDRRASPCHPRIVST